jgi:hypothetical protein
MAEELWRLAREGEKSEEHFCRDDCTDPEREIGLVRMPFDEAVERMVDEHLRQQGQEVAVVRGAMPRFVEAGRDYCRRLLAAALGDG